MSANDQQTDPAGAPLQQQAQVASATPNSNAAVENLACQWQGCGERCQSAEQLYDHVCERHVGRKSTNNLNLTCQWGTCRTTTVKRDHITSHIRVHVPLKPHKCEFCGKAFKRPQDLKKHVKTHADDSVIMRSPEPTGGARSANGGVYPVSNGKTPGYYETPVSGQGYNGHVNAPYYPQPPPQQHNSSYGSVYYQTMNQGADIGNQASYEARKRGYEALDQFFADLKRRNFDPASYAAVGQRLMALQGLQLPDVIVPAYQPAPAMIAAGGHGGHHGGSFAAPSYALPPMPNLRTKNDLTSIDQFLEQMQATVYENDTQVAAAGVGQPGAHYVPTGMHYRSSHSPPSVQLPSSHQTATAPIMGNNQAHSPHGTPALTPPSSSQSYTSGHSPSSVQSHHYSPQQQTSGGMYPTLPATSTHDSMDTSYSATNAPTSTLGPMYDNGHSRRYSGGMLQRAAPAPAGAESMDSAMSDASTATPPARSPKTPKTSKPEIASALIDPALSGASTTSPAGHSSRSDSAHGDEKTAEADGAEEQWVENIRLIERLRGIVREKLQKREYFGDDGLLEEESEQMEGVQHEDEARGAEKQDEILAYPTIRDL